jgi:hypothetical protein
MEIDQKLYLLKLSVEGVEQIEDANDGGDDPGDEEVDLDGFDELEDPGEARTMMDADRNNQSANMHFGSIASPIPGHRNVSDVPECWEDMELDDIRLIIQPSKCKSFIGESVENEWQCASPASTHSLPVKMDHANLDEAVWEFEFPDANQIDEDAFANLHKSASAAYRSHVLEAFNLAETDEDVSDGIESDKEDDQMETLAREVVDRIGSSRKNLLPVLEQMAASSEKSVIIPDNTNAKCKKQAWGPVVATSKMATRYHGGQNVIEKAKEYQKRKNLEVPPSFKGNSFALLHPDILNGMSRQVNIKIGNDTCDSTFVTNELVDNELNKNLNFARDNPTVVLPDNLDVGDVQLSDLSHPRSLISTRSVPDHQLIDPGLGAIVTGRDNSLINNYTSGLS